MAITQIFTSFNHVKRRLNQLTIIVFLVIIPYDVFAQNTDSTTTSFRGGGVLGSLLLIWWICRSRRHKPIGGWLLYYVINVFGGFFVLVILRLAALEIYSPYRWSDNTYYFLYLLTLIPDDLFTIAELILVLGLTIEKYRSWKVVQRLRWILGLSIVFSLLSIFIKIKFFESKTVNSEIFQLLWSVVWLLYFIKSERVRSIYRDNNFEMLFGKSVKFPKVTTFKEPETLHDKLNDNKFKETKICENCGVDYTLEAFPDNSSICVDCQTLVEENTEENTIDTPVNEALKTKGHKSSEPKPNKREHNVLLRNLDAITLFIGGILIALRLFFPPKYYYYRGLKLPFDGTKNLVATVDYQTVLLQSLGIAVITGVLFFILRRGNKE